MTRKPFDPDLIKVPPEEQLAGDGPISVSQLTAMVKRALSRLPPKLAVAGEISNFSRSPNGHLYFTLKDESAAVSCVMWRSSAARLKFEPESGLAVIAFGQVDVYEPRGQYQLYVSRLAPQGRGELELAFRQLCERLEKRGWFDAERKRAIPRIPRAIGVVTSRTGAAVRDILRTLALRWPAARVVVADARVQGEEAGESIAAAVGRVNRHAAALGGVDVLIVARGGGSLEDLWAFNTETVARAILHSRIPVVTGVGHEIDTTVADLVADVRAATPTAAAQAVVPDRREIRGRVAAAGDLMRRLLGQHLRDLAHRLGRCARAEMFRRPQAMLRAPRQRLDELIGRLRWARREADLLAERRLTELAHRLEQQSPRARLAEGRGAVGRASRSLRAAAGRYLAGRAGQLDAREAQLAAYDPQGVLRRGYSMTTLKETATLLTRAGQVRPGDRVVTDLAEGKVESEVTDPRGRAGASTRGRGRKRRDDKGSQMNLEF